TRSKRDWSSDVCSSDLAKRFLADLLDRDPVGEQADIVELDSSSRFERLRHRRRIHRLDPDDADFGTHALDVRRYPRDEPAAADRSEERRVGKEWRARRE